MGNSASIGDVVLGIRIDDAALNAGLAAARARIEGTAPVVLPAPRFATGAPPPPPPIQLPQFNPAELERIRVAQGLTAQSTRGIGVAAQAAQPQLAGLRNSLGQAAASAAQVAAAQSGIPPELAAIGGAISAPIALGAAFAVAGGFAVKSANDMENVTKQLTLVTGSTAAADAAFKNLQQYGKVTPFETGELVAVASQLTAFGLTTSQAVEFTRRLGDAATATKQPLSLMALTLGQIVSKGFADKVDLKEFASKGIPIMQALSAATGKTVTELQALEGGIPADAVLQAFRIMTNEGGVFYEAGVKGATALDREWATLMDTLKAASIPLGKLLTPAVVGLITEAAKGVETWGRAFENVKAKAEELGKNPIAAKLLGIGGQIAGFVANQLPLNQLNNAAGKLAGEAPKQETASIPTTDRDLEKVRQQEEARKAAAAAAAEDAKKQREKEERDAVKRFQEAQRLQIEYNKTQADLQKLSEIQSKLSPGGQGLGIAGINPQTVAQVQQIATTLDLTGDKLAQSLVNGAIRAGEELIKARQQLFAAEQASFDLLRDNAQQDLLTNAVERIKGGIGQTRLDPVKIEELLGVSLQDSAEAIAQAVNPEELFKVADQVDKLAIANETVKAATEANTKALGDLQAALVNVPRVNVTVPAGSAVDSNANTEVRYN